MGGNAEMKQSAKITIHPAFQLRKVVLMGSMAARICVWNTSVRIPIVAEIRRSKVKIICCASVNDFRRFRPHRKSLRARFPAVLRADRRLRRDDAAEAGRDHRGTTGGECSSAGE